jgi:hypothetical protein
MEASTGFLRRVRGPTLDWPRGEGQAALFFWWAGSRALISASAGMNNTTRARP